MSDDPIFRTAVDGHLTSLLSRVAALEKAIKTPGKTACPPHNFQPLSAIMTAGKYRVFCTFCAEAKEV